LDEQGVIFPWWHINEAINFSSNSGVMHERKLNKNDLQKAKLLIFCNESKQEKS
jgi:hypothetical protein